MSTTNRVWPPGHTLAAETRLKLHFHGLVSELGGAFAPPIFIRSPMVGLAYKYLDFQSLQVMTKQRIELRIICSLLLRFLVFFLCNFYFSLCN